MSLFALSSSDRDLLSQTNDKVIAALNANPLVTDVNSSLASTTLENDFVPDPDRLAGTGLQLVDGWPCAADVCQRRLRGQR